MSGDFVSDDEQYENSRAHRKRMKKLKDKKNDGSPEPAGQKINLEWLNSEEKFVPIEKFEMVDEADKTEDVKPKTFERMNTAEYINYQKQQFNPKHLDFRYYANSKNLLTVTPGFTNQINFDWREQYSNRTLFHPAILAKPIQLKSILNTIAVDYTGVNAPDRYNQSRYTYCQRNGIMYRNFESDIEIEEKNKKLRAQ
jgi:hypothetical protein